LLDVLDEMRDPSVKNSPTRKVSIQAISQKYVNFFLSSDKLVMFEISINKENFRVVIYQFKRHPVHVEMEKI
jgi:hypothetical protein